MFSSIKPKADLQDLFARGTDLKATGRFHETLAFNNFTQKDQNNLKEIFERVVHASPTMQEMFIQYLNEISTDGQNAIPVREIDNYLHSFFNASRDDRSIHK